MDQFHGLTGGLARLSGNVTRSISAENPHGEKAKGGMAVPDKDTHPARDLGQGWKIRPYVMIPAGDTFEMAAIEGPGIIQHIWLTTAPKCWRTLILRAYWDGEAHPSIEVPLGDFFCNGWCERSNVRSVPIAVNPAGGFNSYWEMPFNCARLTIENIGFQEACLYYQVTYELGGSTEGMGRLHAQFRRSNPLPYKTEHTILAGVRGQGHYVGTYLAWGVNNNNWWGEGEIKFFMDGDGDFATIVGTGTEDYFGGAWNFEDPQGEYGVFSNLYTGLSQVSKPDGLYKAQQRFGLYRFHMPDPIRFQEDLRVNIQALGWRSGGRFLPMQDDIASVGLWYQNEPHAAFPQLPDRDGLEVI